MWCSPITPGGSLNHLESACVCVWVEGSEVLGFSVSFGPALLFPVRSDWGLGFRVEG